jgi:hypothetical protein
MLHPTMSTATWAIGIATMVIMALFLVTLLALTLGLSVLRGGIMREKGTNRRSMYLLTWVPLVTGIALVVLDLLQTKISNAGRWTRFPKGRVEWVSGHPLLAALMGNLMWTLAIGGWILTMAGLFVVAKRVNLPPATLRFGRTVSVLTSISLSLTFLAFVAWDVANYVQANQAHVAGAVIVTYPRHDLWLPVTLALGLACAASISGASSARRTWRVLRAQRLWDT